jgi:ubiquinone/menaquinone biosynthesis C-methylase UbiE
VKAASVSYLVRGMERAFESDREPTAELNRLLANLATFFESSADIGFGELAAPAQPEAPPDHETETIEARTGDHYGRLFAGFSAESYWNEPARLLRMRFERNGIGLDALPAQRVLDAGCGGGRYTAAWRKLGARAATGLDLSPRNIQTAREQAAQAGIRNLEFEVGNVLALPFDNDSFDVVFSNGVLHHTTDWQRGVAECVRVLKPGGLGWLYLIENPGGLFWDVMEFLRVITQGLDGALARRTLQTLGLPANRIFYLLDHVLAPINIRLTPAEIVACLEAAGATAIRRLARGGDFDRIERIHRGEPFAEAKYGVGENRFVFSK